MSSIRAWACSHFDVMGLTRCPSRRFTQRWSNTASMATTPSSSEEIEVRSLFSSTPQVRAASRALGEIGSHPPNTSWSSEARGTKSRIRGLRSSSRAPRRMWASWLIEPMGGVRPARAARTPAMKVEATAPRPGVRTPSLPAAGAIVGALEEVMVST